MAVYVNESTGFDETVSYATDDKNNVHISFDL